MPSVVVISGPAVVVQASEARTARVFSADDGDDYVNALLAIAQAQIDGPTGWLGRAIGAQTLELRCDYFGAFDTRLLCPPVKQVVSVEVEGVNGSQTVDPPIYRLVGLPERPRLALVYGAVWPSFRPAEDAVRIRYEAGYVTVPAPIKHAIIMMAGVLRDAVPSDSGALKSETVEGVGRWDYALPDGAAEAMQKVAETLLSPYRVYA